MWQTPGTHASSTFHAAHSADAGLLPSSQHPFVRPHNLPAKWRRRRWSHPWEGSAAPHPLYLASSCLPTLTASILSFFSPQRGDTKRHLPGRDKPISEMQRGGGPDATRLSFPSSSPLLPSFSHGESHAALGFKHH